MGAGIELKFSLSHSDLFQTPLEDSVALPPLDGAMIQGLH